MITKIIIAGGRHFNDYALLKKTVDEAITNIKSILKGEVDIEIVSGGATGADSLGEKYATEHGYQIKRFPADWAKYGNAAGPIRNREMAAYSDCLICFWNGYSRGTKNMLDEAKKKDLTIKLVMYD